MYLVKYASSGIVAARFLHRIDTDDTDTLLTCDDLINVMKETDWLAMRQQFARSGSASSAFKLTTTSQLASSV